MGDLDSIPGLEKSPGQGKGYPLQYSGLENAMDYSPWGHKESDMTEQLSLHFTSMGVRPRVLLDDGTWNIHMTGLTLMAFKARSELNYLMR